MKHFVFFATLLSAVLVLCGVAAAQATRGDATGARGGTALVLGYADQDTAIEVVNSGQYLVAQVVPAEKAPALRARLFERGMLGAVTVLDAVVNADGFVEVPMLDNTTALILSDGTLKVSRDDVLRALRPRGVARLGDEKEIRKPWPEDIGDWTHYRYDASRNELSKDRRVGRVSGTQWVAGDNRISKKDALRVADGVAVLPEFEKITGRDAFSGVLLWSHDFSGNYRGRRRPASQYTILIHEGRVIFHALEEDHARALDLHTGKELLVYKEGMSNVAAREPEKGKDLTKEELARREPIIARVLDSRKDLAADGIYFQLLGSEIWALQASDGKLLWHHRHPENLAYDRPAYIDGRLVVSESTHPIEQYMKAYGYMRDTVCRSRAVRAFDGRTGEILWTTKHRYPDAPTVEAAARKGVYYLGLSTSTDERKSGPSVDPGKSMPTIAVDVKSGKVLWDRKLPTLGYSTPSLIVTDTHLWLTTHTGGIGHRLDGGEAEPVQRTIDLEDLDLWGCNKVWMTENHLFCRLTAIDVDQGKFRYTTAARSQCVEASVPAHGLVYNVSQSCGCYSFLPANNAVHCLDTTAWATPWKGARLHRGTASAAPAKAADPEDWPMFMRDNLRSNWSSTRLANEPQPRWTLELPASKAPAWIQTEWQYNEVRTGPVTPVVLAEGVAVYALTDQHTVMAVNPDTGANLWRAHLDGAVDSPPTIHRGAVYVGTRSGTLYALNRDSGEVIWRFMAAPHPRAIAVHGQLESVWPLHGSINVYKDKLYFVAGRNAELDAGMFWYALNPVDGRVELQGRLYDPEEVFEPGKSRERYERIMGNNSPLIMKEGMALTTRAGFNPETGELLTGGRDFVPSYYYRREAGQQDYAIPGMYGLVNVGFSQHTRMGTMASYRAINGRTFAFRGDDVIAHMAHIKSARGGLGHVMYRFRGTREAGEDGQWGEVLWKQRVHDGPRDGNYGMGLAVADNQVAFGSSVNGKPGVLIRDLATGEQIGAIELESPITHLGITAAQGRLFLTTRDGRVLCLK